MIYIVTPVHNRRELTRRCLECLSMQTYPHYKIIVVDDGSTNLTVRYHFAMVHSRTKLLYFALDVARICAGFLRRKFQKTAVSAV